MTSELFDVCPGCYGRTEADDDRCPGCGTSLGGRSFPGERSSTDAGWSRPLEPGPDSRSVEISEPSQQEVADAVS
jgi:hypothetical protein